MVEHVFKTIYFPREKTRVAKSTRVTISLPAKSHGTPFSPAFLSFIRNLSSRDFRLALKDPYLEDLERLSEEEGRSLSNTCIRLLHEQFGDVNNKYFRSHSNLEQIQLPLGLHDNVGGSAEAAEAPIGVTFRENRHKPVHAWYPFVEGFSSTYVRDALLRYGTPPRTVYDPFGGTGTTQLTASLLGIPSFYSEVNPFMVFVSETKVKSSAWARKNLDLFKTITKHFLKSLKSNYLMTAGSKIDLSAYKNAFPERGFFKERHLRDLLAAKDLAHRVAAGHKHAESLLLLACAANAVHSSNMTRRADLRRRRSDEYKTRVVDVPAFISKTVNEMLCDIPNLPLQMADSVRVSNDSRALPPEFRNAFDIAITSPPYLNGTNYFRNTKIELWFLDFIKSEKDLGGFRHQAIAAGINNITRSRELRKTFSYVEDVAAMLDEKAGDDRIPKLVRHYFSDMSDVVEGVYKVLVPGGRFILDIGDSRFYGVHVPTHHLLIKIAQDAGFELESSHTLAKRIARDKSDLVQIELVLKKGKRTVTNSGITASNDLSLKLENFAHRLPYKSSPYSKRNWGHSLHSLCSFQGKLKPSIAHWLVKEFVPEAGSVLDPLGGAGTIAFEAAFLGRQAVTNDKNPFSYTVASAKLIPQSIDEAEKSLDLLAQRMKSTRLTKKDYEAASFGLNAKVSDYYHPETLKEVLKARRIFIEENFSARKINNFIWASLLHVLHGNRPYALSRISHPITPLHPHGKFIYRPLIEKVHERVERVLVERLPSNFVPGTSYYGDFRGLTKIMQHKFDAIITSPPFLGMRFDRPNWLRLWFCGWTASDFHKTSLSFLEREQTKSTECYRDFFQMSRNLLKGSGVLVVHIGSGGRGDLVSPLKQIGQDYFRMAGIASENVQSIERHGLKDKGRTTTHHFIVFSSK
jgi:DNA modification methylase